MFFNKQQVLKNDGYTAFWYGVLCQAAENTTGKEPASEAYRQVSYVNDVTRANEQALVEYVTNGALGNSAISYTYGVQRESYAMTQYAATAGGITEALTSHSSGIYYYTGTGSVSNLISSGGNYAYTYSEYGARTVYRTDADGYTDVTAVSYTYEGYGYNGEYTHEALGIQYLRARYYSMGTGTFTSKDTYAGRIESILSQNRYTYVENNPVNFADPSGHAKSGIASALSGIANNLKKGVGAAVNNVKSSVRSGGGNKTGTNKNRQPSGSGGTKDPQRTFLENINIANRGDTFNGADYYSGIVSNASLNALMGNPGGLTFAESIAAKVEAARCIAYARCMNELQQTILMKKKEDGKSKSAPLAVGPIIFFVDIIIRIDNGEVGFRESTEEFIARYEGDPFLTVRVNNDGTYTIGYGFDFSEEGNPEIFNRYLIKEAAEKKGIIDAVNDFVNGTGHGNTEKPLEINQNQYDALMSYFYSNGANVFSDESYNKGIELGGRYADRASGREALREYLIENNGNYNPQIITELFQKSLGGNIKYDYKDRRTGEADLFNQED